MPKEWDGIVSQHINRRFSRPIAHHLANHPRITPNQVTILSFLVGLASSIFFAYLQPLAGGVLAQASSILDGVDGDLAKITNRASAFGSFLDSQLDRFADALIISGMIYSSWVSEPSIYALALGLAALQGSLMVSYSRARAKSDLGIVFKSGVAGYAANRDVRLFVIMIGGILNQVFVTLLLLAFLTNSVIVKRLYDVMKAGEKP